MKHLRWPPASLLTAISYLTPASAKASQALAGKFEVLTVNAENAEKTEKQVKKNTEELEVCSEQLSVLGDRLSQFKAMLRNTNTNTGANSNVAPAPRALFNFGVSDDKKQDRKVLVTQEPILMWLRLRLHVCLASGCQTTKSKIERQGRLSNGVMPGRWCYLRPKPRKQEDMVNRREIRRA
eukprot:scaffold1337_cov108-Skeletonema_dohrnii-CCMP3373.AAC.4